MFLAKARRNLLEGDVAAFQVPDVHLDILPQSERFKRQLIDDLCGLRNTPLAGLEDITDFILTAGCLWIIVLKGNPFSKESVSNLQQGLAKIIRKYKRTAPVFAFAKEPKYRPLRALPASVLNLACLGKYLASQGSEGLCQEGDRDPTCISLEASELSAQLVSKDSPTSAHVFDHGIEKPRGWLSSSKGLYFSTADQNRIRKRLEDALNDIKTSLDRSPHSPLNPAVCKEALQKKRLTMAVLPALPLKSPAKPVGLEVKVRPDKSLQIRWQAQDGARRFQLKVCHFEFEGGTLLAPFHSNIIEVEKCAAHVSHPEAVPKNKAWVVKAIVKAVSEEGLLSEAVQKQVTWDDELSKEETTKDLEARVATFEKKLADFVVLKGVPHILVVGMQHHGKSSHINHLSRCLQCDLTLNDHMDQAPGEEEKTIATKSINVPVASSHMVLIDTPAFPNMNDDMQGKLRTLLSGVKDGTRRRDLYPDKQSYFSKPPHAAIVLMSLCHWRDETPEMQKYLERLAQTVKTASGGTVVFPYVVVVTFCDEFLKDCQKEDPKEELESALEGIKKAALTDHVFPVTNYQQNTYGSARNNEATFKMLSQLLEKAMREDTTTPTSPSNMLAVTLLIGLVSIFVRARFQK